MNLESILHNKGCHVHTISPTATLEDAVGELVRHNIGSLLVRDPAESAAEVLGIITERDILRTQAFRRNSLANFRVLQVMTRKLVTAHPHDDIVIAMRLMTEHRVRHLPVIREGCLCGIVSIGDLVKAHHDELECENHFMRSYIQGEGAELGSPLP